MDPIEITPRKQPRQGRARKTAERILEATLRVLEQDGYDGLNTNRVAEVAEVSIGSLYQYFPNKQSLVVALLDRHAEAELKALSSALYESADATFEETVEALSLAFVETNLGECRRSAALFRQLPGTSWSAELRSADAGLVGSLTVLIRAWQDQHLVEDADRDAHVLASSVRSIVTQSIETPRDASPDGLGDRVDIARLVEEVSTLIAGYLRARRGHVR